MATTVRRLGLSDYADVTALCATLEEHDYVPDVFPQWAASTNSLPVGAFEGQELVGIATLNLVPDSDIAWVNGLRVKADYHRKGVGSFATAHIIALAKEKGVRTLWYSTGSNNEASIGLAKKLGFAVADRVGYFRVDKPFPPHPSPSPNVHPLTVGPERLYEILKNNSELVESKTLPLAWDFDFKTLAGLKRLAAETDFKVLIDEDGRSSGLYYSKTFVRQDGTRVTFSIFGRDQATFVDIMSRAFDDLESTGAGRGVFFLSPKAKDWAVNLGVVPEEYLNSSYFLFQLDPSKPAPRGRRSPGSR